MMEMNLLRGRLLMLVPPLYRRDVTEIGQEINEVLGRYVRGQLIVCSTFGFCAPCSSSF
jgi:predicted PurR-regulated permease PerM